jgi:hypothetical protein
MPIILGYSWIGLLNMILLQWSFWRLQLTIDKKTGIVTGIRMIGPIMPLTGWWSKYVYLTDAARRRRNEAR